MKRSTIVLLSTLVCAVALVLALPGVASASDWQVRTINTPVTGVQPSFIAADSGRLAWTGADLVIPPGQDVRSSRMFLYDLTLGTNTVIPVKLPGSYYNPSADGPWVAYQGHTVGARDDIYLYDTVTGLVQRVTNNADVGDGNDWNPRIDADRIVWQKDDTNAQPGIYLYDIVFGTRQLLIPGSEYRNPDIWGDWVVCVKNDQTIGVNGSEIVLHNLVDKSLTSIAIDTGTMSNNGPRIDNGWVVWASGDLWIPGTPDPWPTYQINLYEIATGQTIQLTNNVAGNFSPSIEGTTVAWQTREPNAIMTYDIASQTVIQVSQVVVAGETVSSPDVDGGTIAWYSNRGLYHAIRSSEATRFPDVPRDYPYYTAIEGMAERGIIEGFPGGYFRPSEPVIRQQFAKMIVLTMAEHDPVHFTPTTSDVFAFKDSPEMIAQTPEGELYPFHYVSKAALTGLTEGYTDGTFRPYNKISRQQVITMIVRAGSRVLLPPPASYKGVLDYGDPTHGQNIRVAEYNGLLDGIVGNSSGGLAGWNTRGDATRGEVAQMLWNLLGIFGLQEIPEPQE